MSLANIKLNSAQRGFTIVELLIVVVVIAILAAITIVSYNGITTRANASAAKSVAATWQKKVELYGAEVSGYPFALTDVNVNGKSYQIDGSSITANVTANNGKSRVEVRPCGTATPTDLASTTGFRITYWDYETNAKTTTPINIGVTTACTTNAWAGTGTGA